ncbi:hypothetical protein AB1Y20_002111 [Prymnesium parvum]|uniref:Uncharacterized protein n=1 Tax=Prymnesium parvum TaxID=97485 RepID=A0AB34J872_PRYPA
MVLLVPPLLEELGAEDKATSRQALAAWQRLLWDAAQRLRSSDEFEPRWQGTLEQLSSVVAGSVVLGGGDDAPDVVPLPSEAMPTVKGSSTDPLVRLEGPSGMPGRYAQLSVVISSSVGIWPAVVAVADAGGTNSRRLRGQGGRPVRLQVVSRSASRLGFRLVEAETGVVVITSDNVEEVAAHVEDGPRPVPWAAFLEGCLWGLPASVPAPRDSTTVTANGPHMRAMAALWGLNPQLHEPQVPLLAPVAFMAAATALPDTRATANELAVHWEKSILDKEKFFETVEHALFLMTSAAHTPAVLSAAAPARALDAVSAAIYMGEVLQNSVSMGAPTAGARVQPAALESPRARRSMAAGAGGSTYLTRVTPVASPVRAQQSPRATPGRGVDSDGDEIMSPESMARELSRALTARLLRKLCRVPGFDYRSRRGILRWAIVWVGHNLLLRGGEFGAPDRKRFSSTVGITLADVEWISPCAETGGYCVVVRD